MLLTARRHGAGTTTRRYRLGSVAAGLVVVLSVAASGPVFAASTVDPSGLAGLSRQTRSAFLAAQETAHEEGVELSLTSGWRSHAQQQRLFDADVVRYGSVAEARKWVLPPEESAHVKGYAVDVGPQAGAHWLEGNGEQFGLCRRYANEWWHFEYDRSYKQGCPDLLPDASEQPPDTQH